jgi:uncharacterized protein YggT (Ycf19 family)
MSALDFLLNLAGLLLWLSWRSVRFASRVRVAAGSLIGTVKPAETRLLSGWPFLVGLAVLLGARALIYWQLGSPADWTPKLELGWVILAFRSDSLPAVALFSVLSFLRLWLLFYFWLLVLAAVNRRCVEPDPVQRIIRLHLGFVSRWPWALQLLATPLASAVLWMSVQPLLIRCGVTDESHSLAHLFEQGLLVGSSLFFSLKYLLPVFLFLYLLASYIYLGKHTLWDFISTTARNLLAPLRGLPLRFSRLDFAPIAGVALIFLLLHWLPGFVVAALDRRHLTLWPQ